MPPIKCPERERRDTREMDDGYSGIHLLMLLVLVVLEAVLYGFGAAVQELSDTDLEEKAEEGDKKAARLMEIAAHPARLINTNLVFASGATLLVGAFIFRKMVWSSANPLWAVLEALIYIVFEKQIKEPSTNSIFRILLKFINSIKQFCFLPFIKDNLILRQICPHVFRLTQE